jgi:hypothetical protein
MKAAVKLDQLFGFDPAPGRNKQLRVRYRMVSSSLLPFFCDFI